MKKCLKTVIPTSTISCPYKAIHGTHVCIWVAVNVPSRQVENAALSKHTIRTSSRLAYSTYSFTVNPIFDALFDRLVCT